MGAFLQPCRGGCPVKTDVAGYIDAIVRGAYNEAYEIIRANNPFPFVCAWVCPHPCEDGCRRAGIDEALNIRLLKKFVVERVTGQVETTFTCQEEEDIPRGDVAVIGGGPAGLTAAYDLVRRGLKVTVFEQNAKPGGHLYASIPLYRLPREALFRDLSSLMQPGLTIRCGVEVGKDVTLDFLRGNYRAVIVAAGLQKSKMLPIPGAGHPAVQAALDYLQGVNLGRPLPTGKRVIVVGGGDVAMDVARTALRQGAAEVTVVCLEAREEMPAHAWEVEEALEEGAILRTRWGPKEISIANEESINGLLVQKVTRVFDAQGAFSPEFDPGVTEFIAGDNVIFAIGQAPSLSFARDGGLALDERGNLVADKKTMTAEKGVFACGEVLEGPGPAIAAIASGYRVAARVAAYLNGQPAEPEREKPVLDKLPLAVAEKIPRKNRQSPSLVPPGERVKNFAVFEGGLSEGQSLAESARCLRCGLGPEVDVSRCVGCLTCSRVCPFGVPAVESKAYLAPEACQACGICAAACPAGAITMPGRSVKEGLGSTEHPVIIYACRRARGLEDLRGLQGEAVTCRVLPCAGSLRRDAILLDVEKGARAIAVVTCSEGCAGSGSFHCPDEYAAALKLLGDIGFDTQRLARFSGDENLQEELQNFITRYSEG